MPDSEASIRLPKGAENQPYHRNFTRYVMSDVYALIDYMSGRAVPTLASLPHMRSRSDSHPRRRSDHPEAQADPMELLEMECDAIRRDLANEQLLLCRAMKIGHQIDQNNHDISPADAAFLIEARDLLNVQAAPATGSSIVFTNRVIEKLPLTKSIDVPLPQGVRYIVADEFSDRVAVLLANFVQSSLTRMLTILILTVCLSMYVACGKLLLDTRDAVNLDDGKNTTSLIASMSESDVVLKKPLPDAFCDLPHSNSLVAQTCQQRNQLAIRKTAVGKLIKLWVWPFFRETSGDDVVEVEQWATTAIGVLGNYLLPVLYGALGSYGFVLRRLNRQLADCLLTPRDLRANRIRIILGTVTGACIGLFVNSSAGAATLTGVGGAAVTLSASGIAFLAGYGVEAVFKLLDSTMTRVFNLNGEHKNISHS
jgi:hypothetical protein